MRESRVLIEYRGPDRPALIWRETKAWEQWLGEDVLDRMGVRTTAMFWAERIDGVWLIGQSCEPEVGAKAGLLRSIRAQGTVSARAPGARPAGTTIGEDRT